jgi:transcriptional regulator with XRE-family HTH domain
MHLRVTFVNCKSGYCIQDAEAKVNNLLRTLLDDRIKQDGISIREAARQIGIGHSTVIRILGGEAADIDTLVAICKWLGISLSEVLNSELSGDTQLASEIATVIRANPQLEPVFREAMDRLKDGSIDPATIADLVAYTNYRLQIAQGKYGADGGS